MAVYENRHVYLTGGMDYANDKVSIYDAVMDQWNDAAPLKRGREYHASVCQGQHVYVFGGQQNDGSIETAHVGLG